MMSVCFPAGGSLYYAQDLAKAARKPDIPLKDERFCISLDVRLPLWYGREEVTAWCRPGTVYVAFAFFLFRYSFEPTDG